MYDSEENDLLSSTGERFKITDNTFLLDAIKHLSIPLLIIIDGLDKASLHISNCVINA